MPGLATRHVEMDIELGEGDRLVHRAAAAVGGDHEGIDDEPLQIASEDTDAKLECARRPDVVSGAKDRAAVGGDTETSPVALEIAAGDRERVALPDVAVGRRFGSVAHLGEHGRAGDSENHKYPHPERSEGPADQLRECARLKRTHQSHSLRSRPVISGGTSSPSMPNTVGATSRREPPGRSDAAWAPTATNGTGFVVCAVCTP